jgi:hypothetical protein
MRAIVTPSDLKRGDIVDPGWYQCVISDYAEKEAGTDKSTNCIFTFKIEATRDGKPTKFTGCQGNKMMNEKALGFGKKLYEVLGFPKTLEVPGEEEKGYELSSDLFRQTIGSRLLVYFKVSKSNKDNEFNDPTDFDKIK